MIVAQSIPAGSAVGDAVRLIVRPEAIEVVRDRGGSEALLATVLSHAFLGEKTEYVIRCADEVLQAVRYNAGIGGIIPDGEIVGLRFADDAVTVLPGHAS
ncbi:MAG: TOBE domain-containing protein [Betaproteobacteria bacterium]|nr:MAG: TOBE domain-containing protein [Betaproteobacteria bacterium]